MTPDEFRKWSKRGRDNKPEPIAERLPVILYAAPSLAPIEQKLEVLQQQVAMVEALAETLATVQRQIAMVEASAEQQMTEIRDTSDADTGRLMALVETLTARLVECTERLAAHDGPVEVTGRDEQGRAAIVRKGNREFRVERGEDGRALRLV